ncbi:MAG: hypothetical protein ACOVQH_06140 [Burkholderiaceae bacterium]|jgi:hypothetical protein
MKVNRAYMVNLSLYEYLGGAGFNGKYQAMRVGDRIGSVLLSQADYHRHTFEIIECVDKLQPVQTYGLKVTLTTKVGRGKDAIVTNEIYFVGQYGAVPWEFAVSHNLVRDDD